jgi:hypothetical protein
LYDRDRDIQGKLNSKDLKTTLEEIKMSLNYIGTILKEGFGVFKQLYENYVQNLKACLD